MQAQPASSPTMPWRLLSSLLLAALLLPAQTLAQTLRVAAASSLSEAMQRIAQGFEREHPGVALRCEFAASGQLLQRIAGGATFDLFISADEASMKTAAPYLQPGSEQIVASNTLVLVVPASNQTVTGPADLIRVPRIAIGDPATVPVGWYARQALQQFGLWETLQRRLRLAADAQQVLSWMLEGQADAALAYRSDALRHASRLRVVSELGGHEPIRYWLGQLRRSAQPALARQFTAYLRGAEARDILRRHGFSVITGS